MTDAVSVLIGGEQRPLPPLTFARLKRIWPLIERGREVLGRIERVDLSLGVIAALLGNVTADDLAEQLLPAEMDGVIGAVPDILIAGGLISREPPTPGEAMAAGSTQDASTT